MNTTVNAVNSSDIMEKLLDVIYSVQTKSQLSTAERYIAAVDKSFDLTWGDFMTISSALKNKVKSL